jgi:hypothetical protein
MTERRSKAGRPRVRVYSGESRRRPARPVVFGTFKGNGKLGSNMSAKSTGSGNDYLCAIEKNQNGKYTVRVRAVFGRGGWILPVYFLASSFNGAMKKLEESLQFLQKNEERLRFWGVERTDDPNMAGELLEGIGLWLDRRKEYPRKVAELAVSRERAVPASMLAPVRRILADSMAQERTSSAALAGD